MFPTENAPMKKLLPSLLAGALLLGLTGSAVAGSASTSLTAGVTVAQACQISATPMSFGSVGLFSDATHGISGADHVPAQNALTLYCTAAEPITIAISGSNGGNPGVHIMTGTGSNTDQVLYRIFQDSANTQPWDGSTHALTVTAIVGTNIVPVYGEILGSDQPYAQGHALGPAHPDSYTDTLTATVTY
jgi:spore coat protein U-like protein